MKSIFKKTIVVLAMALMGTCFAAEPGQKLLGKVKTTDYVVTQECDNVFNDWVQKPRLTFTNETLDFTTTKDLFLIGGKSLQYWLDDAIRSYHETDPFFSSWIGSPDITFSNPIVRFQYGTSSIYIEGHTLAWWLEQAVLPTQTDLNTFKVSTNGKIDVLTENLHNLSTRYDASVREIERLGGDLHAFNSTIDEMNRDVAGFRSDLLFFKMTLRDFQIYVTNNFERLNDADIALGARIDNTNAELEEFETETTNTIARLDSADEALGVRIDNANTAFDAFKTETTNNVARLDAKDAELNTKIDNANTALNQRIDDTNTSLDTFKTETTNAIARLDTKDSETAGNLESLSNKVVDVEGDLSYVSNKVVTVEENLESLSNQVARVETDLDFTSNKTVKVESDLNNVSNKVEEIYGDYVKLTDLQAGITFDTMNVTNIMVNGEHVSLESHKHDDKLDATNGVAYGTLTVYPEMVPGGLIGSGHAFMDNESLRFTSTTMAPDITYGLNGISALFGADNVQWYEFNDSTNGIARLKNIPEITTNGVAVAVKDGKVEIPLNEYVKLADLQEGIQFNTMEVTNLTVNGKQVSTVDHTHQLWEIPGAEAAATTAIQEIDAAGDLDGVKNAMKNFLLNFKKPTP